MNNILNKDQQQELFDYMSNEHDVLLLQSEMQEIENIFIKAVQSEAVAGCRHEIIDARNEVIESGYMCTKCGAFFSGQQSSQSEAMEKDVISHNTHHKFKLWDRIKILLGKKLTVHSEIETKNNEY
ncbi:hypothetical protein LCGC14_0503560 [marine sediment metagenome]|uniref:Uncharacterized protein n=1 Tax=marine sediment metagenome TaxID=412755 RepID=A0A0F9VBP5_9ZZZZ